MDKQLNQLHDINWGTLNHASRARVHVSTIDAHVCLNTCTQL